MSIMIQAFTTLPPWIQILLICVHGGLVLGLAWWGMQWLAARAKGRPDRIPVGPYFVSVTTLYALFLAFHASTIWTRQHAAEQAFEEAVTAIARLESLFGHEGLGLEQARLHLADYVDAVVNEEWASGNTRASARASQALANLRQDLIQTSPLVPTALGNHLWRVFDDVVDARNGRLWIGSHGRSENSWGLVLVLGLLAHIAIGWVHADRTAAGTLALALFAITTSAAYWHLLQASDPFAHLETSTYFKALAGHAR